MDKLQEYYDQLMAACDDGTFPSYAPDEGNSNGCWYRSPDGKRCAVGIRIPDELYDPELEGTSYADLPEPGRLATGLEDVLGEWDVQAFSSVMISRRWIARGTLPGSGNCSSTGSTAGSVSRGCG
jgi:hypothetical protein